VIAGDFTAGAPAPQSDPAATAPSAPPPDELPLDTTEARRAAEAAGGVRAHAYKVWSAIESSTRYLLKEGHEALALSRPEQELLERAAYGEPIEEEQLIPLLARAERLDTLLAWRVLKHYPRWPR
jgi:hypothetical protein